MAIVANYKSNRKGSCSLTLNCYAEQAALRTGLARKSSTDLQAMFSFELLTWRWVGVHWP